MKRDTLARTSGEAGRVRIPDTATLVPSFVSALLGTQFEPSCRSVWFAVPEGKPPDEATVSVCPDGVRGGNIDCDSNTETICQTACVNMMHFSCVCTSRGAGNDRWVCASREMMCQ